MTIVLSERLAQPAKPPEPARSMQREGLGQRQRWDVFCSVIDHVLPVLSTNALAVWAVLLRNAEDWEVCISVKAIAEAAGRGSRWVQFGLRELVDRGAIEVAKRGGFRGGERKESTTYRMVITRTTPAPSVERTRTPHAPSDRITRTTRARSEISEGADSVRVMGERTRTTSAHDGQRTRTRTAHGQSERARRTPPSLERETDDSTLGASVASQENA